MIVCFIYIAVATYRIWSDSVTTEHALVLDTSIIYLHLCDIVWL